MQELSNLYGRTGNAAAGERIAREAYQVEVGFSDNRPTRNLLTAAGSLADRLREGGNPKAANPYYEIAAKAGEELVKLDASAPSPKVDLAILYLHQAYGYQTLHQFPEALQSTRRSIALLEAAIAVSPGNKTLPVMLADHSTTLAELLFETGDLTASRQEIERTGAIYTKLAADDPNDLFVRQGEVCVAKLLLRIASRQSDWGAARVHAQDALTQLASLEKEQPKEISFLTLEGETLGYLVAVYEGLQLPQETQKTVQRCLQVWDRVQALRPLTEEEQGYRKPCTESVR